jgi:hypothetical protein
MIKPIEIFESLFETFDKSSILAFRRFIKRNASVTKWIIAADYCLHDPTRPNDSFVFSLVPYDDWFGALQEEIRTALPKDLKKTKSIGRAAIEFLSSERRFHIGFVVNRGRVLFTNGRGSNALQVARGCIDKTYRHVVEKERSKDTVKRMNRLRQQTLANSANIELLTDLLLLSWFFPFVSLLLARECPVRILGWLPDRDSMTTWCNGVVWDFAGETLRGVAERYKINVPRGSPVLAVPGEQNGMWFDEFVRIADYVAGLLASWDFQANKLPGTSDKYIRLAEDVFSDSTNMSVLKVTLGEAGMQCHRIVAKKRPAKNVDQAEFTRN